MPPKQRPHLLSRSVVNRTPQQSSRNNPITLDREHEAVVVEDLSVRRKRTGAPRSTLLIPSALGAEDHRSKRHRATAVASSTDMNEPSHDDFSPGPAFDSTPADFDQFAVPPELEGVVIDHHIQPPRNRKVSMF